MNTIEIDISEDLLKESVRVYNKLKGVSLESTRNLSKYRDFYGTLGQYGVIGWMEEQGLDPTWHSYVGTIMKGDEYDFIWRYETCDVKSSPVSKEFPKVYPNSRLLVKNDTKEVDRLVFTKINIKERKMYIPGCISWHSFWDTAKPLESVKSKHPCSYVLAKNLDPFKDFAYGV